MSEASDRLEAAAKERAEAALRRAFPGTAQSTDPDRVMEASVFVIGYRTALRDERELAYDDDGEVVTSAEFGELTIVQILWNTDFDGRQIDPDKEEYPATLYGPFLNSDLAQEWADAYPEDTDIYDMNFLPLNKVRP